MKKKIVKLFCQQFKERNRIVTWYTLGSSTKLPFTGKETSDPVGLLNLGGTESFRELEKTDTVSHPYLF
jgi:hypothetical protein